MVAGNSNEYEDPSLCSAIYWAERLFSVGKWNGLLPPPSSLRFLLFRRLTLA